MDELKPVNMEAEIKAQAPDPLNTDVYIDEYGQKWDKPTAAAFAVACRQRDLALKEAKEWLAQLLVCKAEIERLTKTDSLHPTPFDLESHMIRQRDFSLTTFGPGARTLGVVDHIRKELIEIESDPTDIKEWVDVIILAFDGAWRAGWEPKDIVAAIVAKQTKNEALTWPDRRTSDPDKAMEHVRGSHD